MQRAFRVASAVFAVLFAAWAQQSWQLSLQDALGPGPGFFPFCLSLAGVVLSIVLIVKPPQDEETGNRDAVELVPRGAALVRLALMILALIAATALLDVLGYRLVMAVFCIFLLWVTGARNWWVIVLFSAAASFGVDALFSGLLKVPLPHGVFEP